MPKRNIVSSSTASAAASKVPAVNRRGSSGRGPSMADVAALAGVSAQTVSRVLNSPETVRASTRDRVQQVIDEIGYHRNSLARSLRTDRSDVIGIVSTATSLYSPMKTMHEIEMAARKAGFSITVSILDAAEKAVADDVFGRLLEHNVDGIIVIGARSWVASLAQRYANEIPAVVTALVETVEESALKSVSTDNELGARMAVRHLVEMGHRRIDHVCGPREFYDSVDRMRGWRKELAAQGLMEGNLYHGTFQAKSGYEIGLRIAAEKTLPDAVFVSNDQMAVGLYKAFAEQGIDVPGEVSVVGFDDIEGSAYMIPALTTVAPDYAGIGREVVNTLMRALQGESTETVLLSPRLVCRESVRRRS